jgi:hypothetical protein
VLLEEIKNSKSPAGVGSTPVRFRFTELPRVRAVCEAETEKLEKYPLCASTEKGCKAERAIATAAANATTTSRRIIGHPGLAG